MKRTMEFVKNYLTDGTIKGNDYICIITNSRGKKLAEYAPHTYTELMLRYLALTYDTVPCLVWFKPTANNIVKVGRNNIVFTDYYSKAKAYKRLKRIYRNCGFKLPKRPY
jgi:hypothetical protein